MIGVLKRRQTTANVNKKQVFYKSQKSNKRTKLNNLLKASKKRK